MKTNEMEKYASLEQVVTHQTAFLLGSRTSTEFTDESLDRDDLISNSRQPQTRRRLLSAIFHSALIALNVLTCIIYTNWMSSRYAHGPQNKYSPVKSAISYEPRPFEVLSIFLSNGTLNPNKPTDYNGDPRPALDNAWNKLMGRQNIRLQRAELTQVPFDDSLISLSDGSGYYGTLAVYHGLHCVERLHHYIHKDHYYKGLSEDETRRLSHHTEHCIDWLRQYVQCNADTTVIPFHWGSTQASPIAKDEGTHQCVKWDAVEHWMEERTFDPFQPGLLVHPKFGNPYSQAAGESKDVGIIDGEHLLHTNS